MQWLNPLNFFCLIGPTLPYDVTDGSMAESPDGGVLLFGGRKSFAPDDMEDKILIALLTILLYTRKCPLCGHFLAKACLR